MITKVANGAKIKKSNPKNFYVIAQHTKNIIIPDTKPIKPLIKTINKGQHIIANINIEKFKIVPKMYPAVSNIFFMLTL